MCTKVAKPNGQFHLQDENTTEFIGACYDVFPQVSLFRANVYMFEKTFFFDSKTSLHLGHENLP